MTLHTTPDILELVVAVREFLQQQVMPQTEGHLSFHARVAANVLLTVERELAAGGDDAWAEARLRSVGVGGEAELCEVIRDADSLEDLTGVIAVLDDLTRARLRVSNPSYISEMNDDDPTKEVPPTKGG